MSFTKYSALCFLLAGVSCGLNSPQKTADTPESNAPPPPAPSQSMCVMPDLPEGSVLTISINIQGGQMLQLSDDSIWLINPDDVSTSSSWLSPVPITISASNDSEFPCLLTNTQTNSAVKAKKTDHL